MRCGFELTSSERPTGCQKRRSTSPKGVPGPTRVRISCSSRDSMFPPAGPFLSRPSPEDNTRSTPAARALREEVIALVKGARRDVVERRHEDRDAGARPLRLDIDLRVARAVRREGEIAVGDRIAAGIAHAGEDTVQIEHI